MLPGTTGGPLPVISGQPSPGKVLRRRAILPCNCLASLPKVRTAAPERIAWHRIGMTSSSGAEKGSAERVSAPSRSVRNGENPSFLPVPFHLPYGLDMGRPSPP